MQRNVLHLVSSFEQGGSEGQAVQLARLQHESGKYGVRVACLRGHGVLRAEVERLGLGEIPEFPLTSFYNRQAAVQARRFADYLRRHEIEIVHTHDFYTNIFGMAGASLARVPARIASRRESAKKSKLKRAFERGAYRLAHAVIANCEEIRQQLIREGVRAAKVVTSYNGLDARRVSLAAPLGREEALAALGLPRDAPYKFVTIVANLREVKDHRTFLLAARRVRAEVPEAAFVIAGEGELLGALKTLAGELALAERAFFTGRCEKIAELLSVSEVCVLCSKSEGFSNSILEYMAARRPVVATNVGGAREAIEDGVSGYLIAPGDAEALAERVAGLLRRPEQATMMGERGGQIVREKFSCAAQLERTRNLYESILAGGSYLPASAVGAAGGRG